MQNPFRYLGAANFQFDNVTCRNTFNPDLRKNRLNRQYNLAVSMILIFAVWRVKQSSPPHSPTSCRCLVPRGSCIYVVLDATCKAAPIKYSTGKEYSCNYIVGKNEEISSEVYNDLEVRPVYILS